jgi:hypothetical protein
MDIYCKRYISIDLSTHVIFAGVNGFTVIVEFVGITIQPFHSNNNEPVPPLAASASNTTKVYSTPQVSNY